MENTNTSIQMMNGSALQKHKKKQETNETETKMFFFSLLFVQNVILQKRGKYKKKPGRVRVSLENTFFSFYRQVPNYEVRNKTDIHANLSRWAISFNYYGGSDLLLAHLYLTQALTPLFFIVFF